MREYMPNGCAIVVNAQVVVYALCGGVGAAANVSISAAGLHPCGIVGGWLVVAAAAAAVHSVCRRVPPMSDYLITTITRRVAPLTL